MFHYFQGCSKSVSKVFQGSFKILKGVLRLFCFCKGIVALQL